MEHPHISGLGGWRLLTRGRVSEVWEARQLSLDRQVAVKTYPGEGEEPDRRFKRELAAAGLLSGHPGIITVHDAGILVDDRLYLIMEFCPGGSLSQRLTNRRLGEDEVRRVGVQVADALAAAHAAGVLHRRVAPANILIDGFGNARLADFGLALIAGAELEGADLSPVPSEHAPPEASNGQPATESADVFSLASTLYSLLTGEAPPRIRTTVGIEHAEGPGPPAPAVEGPLVTTLIGGLNLDPGGRPTAAQFRDQLMKISPAREAAAGASGGGVQWPSTSRAESTHPPPHVQSTAGAAVARGSKDPVLPAEARPRSARRRVGVSVLAAVSVFVVAAAVMWLIPGPALNSAVPEELTATAESSPGATLAPATPASPGLGGDPTGPSSAPGEGAIQLESTALSTKPFQVVQVQGTYPGGAERFVRAQHREDGEWTNFPLPAKTDQMGRFTLYVELAKPGRHQLRVVDSESGLKSDSLVVVVQD